MMELTANWQVWKASPGQYENPNWMKNASLPAPMPASVPVTVARLLLDSQPQPVESFVSLNEYDWWFSTDFDFAGQGNKQYLIFDGLATLADIWLNGEKILSANNMFLQYRVDVTAALKETNHLAICFRSISHALNSFKKRPRWKTKLVEHQQLRWIRTTLLGYIPGWAPPVKPIGPWRGIRLEAVESAELLDLDIQPTLSQSGGLIRIKARLGCQVSHPCEVVFAANDVRKILFSGLPTDGEIHIDDEVLVPHAKPWIPHTHGMPELYEYSLALETDGKKILLRNGGIGFRDISLNTENGLFQLRLNGQAVFARGAVWTINDIVSLNGDRETLRAALLLARDAGMNMLRVGGTMVYEQDDFYNLCDELGIMVWQDFMFANMDYPVADEGFHANILAEASFQLKRLQSHPCVVVYCGNSEVEQQAAMLGIPQEMWRNSWFGSELPELVGELHRNTVYVPSTPSGGVFPFYTSEGITHYYGVGAYLRDVNDARRSDVKFTPECLGFSNVPETKTITKVMGNSQPMTHHPLWKSRVPRDNGAGWDFEDVRDHYLAELFGIDAVQLRSADMDRYLALSRAASGEMMSQVFSEWRSTNSNCNGALVWFYKDLLPGAGWGVLDADNTPKSVYYYLKRIFQPLGLFITDEGLQGLFIHLVNETQSPFDGIVEFQLIQHGNVSVAKAGREVGIPAGGKLCLLADELLGGFYDTSYSYRFGPPKYEVACATLKSRDGKIISQQFHFPLKKMFSPVQASVETAVEAIGNGTWRLSISTDSFLHSVQIECDGGLPDDNYFHLMPERQKNIIIKPLQAGLKIPQIRIRSVNLLDEVEIKI